MTKSHNGRISISNKKAHFNYFLFDSFEAGIVLLGAEVKSIRAGKVDITECYVGINAKGEAMLYNASIQGYVHNSLEKYKFEQKRPRKLLLHTKEINKIAGKIKTAGFTLVATAIYINERQKIKIALALAKGKKMHDKREDIKKKDIERMNRRKETE